MNFNKYITYGAIVVVVIVTFLFGISIGQGYKNTENKILATYNEIEKSVSIMIDDGSGALHTVTNIPFFENMNVFDVVEYATKKNNLELKYKDYGGDMGVFIESLGGIGKDPEGKKWWQYWVNNVYSQKGVSMYRVIPGDSIEFKFIKGQE